MQVDGADDSVDNNDFDPADDDDDSSNLSAPGAKCGLCDEPTKTHKTYHLATRHFKQRLIDTVKPVVTEAGRVFRCPECAQDFKNRINSWTHYLGKHRFAEKWTAEMLSVKQEEDTEMAPVSADAMTPVKAEPGQVSILSISF
jgi:hypothetical protein